MTTHSLSGLIGKTITIESITVEEIDIYCNGENVRQFCIISCVGGEQLVLGSDGHCAQQYATVNLMTMAEFDELKRNIHGPDEDDDEDECCQVCGGLYRSFNVLVIDGRGPVCKDCCTESDIEKANKGNGLYDPRVRTAESWLNNWRYDDW